MQGTFEPEDDETETELEEHCEPGRGQEIHPESKRVRLDAIANVPWRNLAPANDRETQQRMREHWGQEIKYSSLTEDKKSFIPKVSPYPEGPDTVFPGTPCYKINVDGRVRHMDTSTTSSDWPAVSITRRCISRF